MDSTNECLVHCVKEDAFDLSQAIGPILGSEYPKKMLPPFRIVDGSQRTTTIPSSIASAWNWGVRQIMPVGKRAALYANRLRNFGRGVSRVATPLLLFEGGYDWVVIGKCALKCKEDKC